MRKSIFNPEDLKEIRTRLAKLDENTQATWGVMKVNEMLRHLVEGSKIITGEMNLGDRSSFMSRTLMRYFVLKAMIPSEKMRKSNPPMTFKEIDVVRTGLNAGDFATEKQNLNAALEKILGMTKFPERHPLFGKMQKKQWGMFVYSHLNYHFTQFGV